MSDELVQAEADALLAMPKKYAEVASVQLPDRGKCAVDLEGIGNKRERFSLDINRSYISFSKITYQNRARSVVVLARLDIDGAPHRNPDDEEIACPHLHLYREGFGDKWAFPLPLGIFSDPADRWKTLQEFMDYCKIVEAPSFERGLLW
ncbi:DUF6978 family protein [Flaviflagellibacter deserti]|uniref:DUF6978 family protein n=1 Tax=Flaviflagellibacter deserti TaxID=2267266 RepID=A0ABV9YXH8_9HYPH